VFANAGQITRLVVSPKGLAWQSSNGQAEIFPRKAIAAIGDLAPVHR
jgi:hypothetical protein